MKTRDSLRWSFVSVVLLGALVLGGAALTLRSASAADPIAVASASGSASVAASASVAWPVGPPKRDPEPEPLEKQTIPTEKSKVPTLDEWRNAKQVEVLRRGVYFESDCKAYLVREWLKIKCELPVGAVFQHSGNPEGVAFWVRPKAELIMDMNSPNPGEMLFPLRQGDRRLLQFFTLRHDSCIGIGFEPSVMVDETWLEGEPAPTVVLR